jgi:hypothetical protein
MIHGVCYTCHECGRDFGTRGGLTRHRKAMHRQFTPAPDGEDDNTFQRQFHPNLNGTQFTLATADPCSALPCDANGEYLPPFSAPPPLPSPPADGQDPDAWAPFGSRVEFDFAHFHYVQLQSSERDINTALDLWAASVMQHGRRVPWKNTAELYATILSHFVQFVRRFGV